MGQPFVIFQVVMVIVWQEIEPIKEGFAQRFYVFVIFVSSKPHMKVTETTEALHEIPNKNISYNIMLLCYSYM